jgi:type I restriction enzyme S subunit
MTNAAQTTEIGVFPDSWQIVEIGEVFKFTSGKTKPKDTCSVPSSQQTIPVYGGNGVLGYTSQPLLEESALILGRVGEYCGCAHLTADKSWVTDNALYVKEEKLPVDRGFVRNHFEYLNLNKYSNKMGQPLITQGIINRVKFALPPLPEQKKIAHILSTVQRAIEAQERIIQTTTKLKKALMHKLFTEGLRNEPQKQTEIGPVPESWEVVELGDLLTIAQYGMSAKGNPEGKYPILRMTNQVDGQIVDRKLQYVEISDREVEKFNVERGDILFNRTNSLDLVGRTSIFDIEGDFVFASYLIRLRTDEKQLDPFFLNCYFNTDEIQARLKSIATRAVSQSNISATRLKGFPVPKPGLQEQGEIVAHAKALDRKLAVHRGKLEQLQDLSRTLLHELMTAKTRVQDIEFSTE